MKSQQYDYKNYRSQESEQVHVTRLSTWLIVVLLIALLSWTFDRDSHPFNDVNVESKS